MTRAWHHRLLGGTVALAAVPALLSCVDTVHEDAVQSLGPEDSSVPPGPLHRPGQPCVTCHGGSGPGKTQFSTAGTVYAQDKSSTPANGALVIIEDVTGATYSTTTNSAGNFYVPLSAFEPNYPVTVYQVSSADRSQNQAMATLINRNGSCADCHAKARGPDSEGPVYLAPAGTP